MCQTEDHKADLSTHPTRWMKAKPSTICLKKKKTKKVPSKGTKNKKETTKVELKEKHSNVFLKKEIAKRWPGVYEAHTWKMEKRKTEPDSTPCINEEHQILSFTDCDHERRDKNCFKFDHVEIVDSAGIKYHCISLRRQINECFSALVCDPEGTMEILDVDDVDEHYECGVYAIANAFELLSSSCPAETPPASMIICWFSRRKFTAFPKIVDACVVDLEPKFNFYMAG
ncbi:hypothetical protein XELAEV_18047561mg [Xenopus laevis]|uniref:Uncharacterized protein n=1 Tax=Xenopus laevis TaxID=8355 RepID=A0A974H201_XENLA|nr:hypothetical protein XELAEV_18047561mg [Xenopus laevis]